MNAFYPTFFLVLSISTLSLSVVRVFGGYSLTLAFIFALIYTVKTFNKIKASSISVLLLFISFLIFNAAINVLWIDEMHFLRSFLLTSGFLYCYISSFTIRSKLTCRINYQVFLFYSIVLIVGFEFLQVLEQVFFKSTTLWFLLDGISISTADDIGRFEAVNFIGFSRPISYYHEPSYLGTVLLVLFAVNDTQVKSKLAYSILFLSILLTLSSTAILFLFAYIAISFIHQYRKYSILILMFAILILIAMPLDIISFIRLDEIFMPGTSGWYRIIFPMQETVAILKKSPFGIPLGQSEIIYDNSLFLIVAYFGVLTPFLALGWIISIKNKLNTNILTIKYLIVFFCFLFVSGAIFTIETAVLSILLNFTFFDKVENDTNINNIDNI